MSVANGAYTRTQSFGHAEASVYPRFHMESVIDPVASQNAGREIHVDEERVEIIMPGNPHTRPVFKVSDEHRNRWPKEYEAFKRGHTIAATGTPLEAWALLKKSQVNELKYLGFNTVEQVAQMDDHALQRIGMGGRQIKNAAIAYLDDAAAGAMLAQATAQNDKWEAENAVLKRQVEELGVITKNLHDELQRLKNAPSALATHIPGMSDPVEMAKVYQPKEPVAESSLANIQPIKRRGRPALPRDEDGSIIRNADG